MQLAATSSLYICSPTEQRRVKYCEPPYIDVVTRIQMFLITNLCVLPRYSSHSPWLEFWAFGCIATRFSKDLFRTFDSGLVTIHARLPVLSWHQSMLYSRWYLLHGHSVLHQQWIFSGHHEYQLSEPTETSIQCSSRINSRYYRCYDNGHSYGYSVACYHRDIWITPSF